LSGNGKSEGKNGEESGGELHYGLWEKRRVVR